MVSNTCTTKGLPRPEPNNKVKQLQSYHSGKSQNIAHFLRCLTCGRVVVFISRVWYSDPTYRSTRGRRADGSRADGGAGGLAGLSSSSSSSSPPSANTARQRSRAYCAVHTEGLNAMPSTFPRLKWNEPKLHYGYQAREKWGKQMWIRPSFSEFFTRRYPSPFHPAWVYACSDGEHNTCFQGPHSPPQGGTSSVDRDRKRPRS